MDPLQPTRFYLALFAVCLAALLVGVFYFVMGMGQSTYLVTDGVNVSVKYLNKPRYDMHLQGLIFTLSFLIAGALLLLLVILPDRQSQAGRRERSDEEPPQPRRRTQPAAEGAVQQPAQPAPAAPPAQGAQAAAAQQPPQPAPQPAQQQTSPLSIESGDAEGEAPPAEAAEPAAEPAPAAQPRTGVSVEEEVLQSAATADDLPALDFADSRFEETGDEDVVYGNGRITEDAAWDFVQLYPDSAVKFLYRKTLDNKTLSPTEEDIYRNWEIRGLTRAKVREIVLEIMRWPSLPDSFPHEIWRELRDQIYELRAR